MDLQSDLLSRPAPCITEPSDPKSERERTHQLRRRPGAPSLCPHSPAAPQHRQRWAHWHFLGASHGHTEQRCMLWTGAAAAASPRSHPEVSHGFSCSSAKVPRTHAMHRQRGAATEAVKTVLGMLFSLPASIIPLETICKVAVAPDSGSQALRAQTEQTLPLCLLGRNSCPWPQEQGSQYRRLSWVHRPAAPLQFYCALAWLPWSRPAALRRVKVGHVEYCICHLTTFSYTGKKRVKLTWVHQLAGPS